MKGCVIYFSLFSVKFNFSVICVHRNSEIREKIPSNKLTNSLDNFDGLLNSFKIERWDIFIWEPFRLKIFQFQMDFDIRKSVKTYLRATDQFPKLEFEEIQGKQLVHHVVKTDLVKLINDDRKTSFQNFKLNVYIVTLGFVNLLLYILFQLTWPNSSWKMTWWLTKPSRMWSRMNSVWLTSSTFK